MPDHPPSENTELLFDQLSLDTTDPGLTAHRKRMIEYEARLNREGGMASDRHAEVLEELNTMWPYHDQEIIVTGKVYVLDEQWLSVLEGSGIDTWTEPRQDERGTYFVVDETGLKSRGIIDVPGTTFDDRTDTYEVGITYGFDAPEIDTDAVMFAVYADDMSMMECPFPTIEAIDARLHRDWPKEMEIVDRLVQSDTSDYRGLVRRLSMLAPYIHDVCRQHDNFAEWVGRYIFERIGFDVKWPYAALIQGTISVCEDEETWRDVSLEQPTLQYCKPGGIQVQVGEHETTLGLIVYTPYANDESEDVDIGVIMPIESIKDLQDTRGSHSIVDAISVAESAPREYIPGDPELDVVDSRETHRSGDSGYDRLVAFETELKRLVSHVAGVRKHSFSSEEAAAEVARRLCGEVHEVIVGHDPDRECTLDIDPTHAAIPVTAVKTDAEGVHINVNNDTVSPELMPGERMTGKYLVLHPAIEHYIQDGEVQYRINPLLVLTDNSRVLDITTFQQIPLFTAAFTRRIALPFDEESRISIRELDETRERRKALGQLAASHRTTSVRHHLYKLSQAFHNEHDDEFQELTKLNNLHEVAAYVMEHAQTSNNIMEALTSLLRHRYVVIEGQVWSEDGPGVTRTVAYPVTDVVTESPYAQDYGPQLVFTTIVTTEEGEREQYLYAPILSITQLKF